MDRLIIFILTLTIFTNCSSKKTGVKENEYPLKFINIWRNGQPIDTLEMKLNSLSFKDSIYNLSYTELNSDGETLIRQYEMPISNSINTFRSLSDTSELRLKYEGFNMITYGGNRKSYPIYKYLFDEPAAADEEMNLYMTPEFGIILIRSRAWGSYGRLINNSNPKDKLCLFYLGEKIITDFN